MKKRSVLRRIRMRCCCRIAAIALAVVVTFGFVLGVSRVETDDMRPALRAGDILVYLRVGKSVNTDVVLYEGNDPEKNVIVLANRNKTFAPEAAAEERGRLVAEAGESRAGRTGPETAEDETMRLAPGFAGSRTEESTAGAAESGTGRTATEAGESGPDRARRNAAGKFRVGRIQTTKGLPGRMRRDGIPVLKGKFPEERIKGRVVMIVRRKPL